MEGEEKHRVEKSLFLLSFHSKDFGFRMSTYIALRIGLFIGVS